MPVWERATSPVLGGSLTTMRMLPEIGWARIFLLAFIVIVRAALSIGLIYAGGIFVGAVPGAVQNGLSSSDGNRLITGLVWASALFVVTMVLPPFQTAVSESAGRRLDGKLRARVMEGVLRPIGMAHLEDPSVTDQLSLAEGVGPGKWTPGDALVGLVDNIATRLTVICAAAIVGRFRWWLGLWILLSGVIFRSRLITEGSKRLKVLLGETEALRRSDYFRDLALTPGAAKETRVFGLSKWILGNFTSIWLGVMSKLWQERKRDAGIVLIWFVPLGGAIFASFALAGRAAIRGEIDLAGLAILAQAILLAGNWIVTNSDLFVEYGAAAINPALELAATETGSSETTAGVTDADRKPTDAINFERVAFRYPGRDENVFTELDLTIPAGQSLALVGANGAGKTTLVKLLTRLYDPVGGRIAVDGVDLRRLDPKSWRRRLSAIFQDFVHYELPASDNVGFGSVDRLGDKEELSNAAGGVGALGLIERLPKGWDTVLSKQYEDGSDLSGGEWQRVALARALFAVKGGAGVMILDEPTANLDVKAEAELFERFLELTAGLTTILISHRFSSVRRADHICVLDEGRVIEQGTHEELIASGGHYARTFQLQASRFQEEEGAAHS